MIKEAILDLLKEQNPDLYYRIYLDVSGYIWGETIYVRRDIRI